MPDSFWSYCDLCPSVDSWACSPFSIWSLFACPYKHVDIVRKNPILYNPVKVWRQIFGKGETVFVRGQGSSIFKTWHIKGIRVIGDLFQDGSPMSIQQLRQKYDIPKQHHFGYLQIQHYVFSKHKYALNSPALSNLEGFPLNITNAAHFSSRFYSFIYSHTSGLLKTIAHKWEKDLCNEHIDDDRREAIKCVTSTFTCNRLRETQYKIMHRLHIMPVIMNKMDHTTSALCFKWHTELGTYFHCFWSCEYISRFWSFIACKINTIFQIK